MFHIVLFEPEIPPNTGNIIRLCANSGTMLHLIQPCGFALDHTKLKRAGLDYHEFAKIRTYPNYQYFLDNCAYNRLFACSTKGTTCYTDVAFEPQDALLFGPETRGLPPEIINSHPTKQILRIPMQPNSRSLNLANAVAIVLYEALRQKKFPLIA